MKVRAMKATDLKRVAGLAGLLVRQHHQIDPGRFMSIPDVEVGYAWWFRSQLGKARVVLLVAEDRGQIVGYAYGTLEPKDWNLLLEAHGAVHDVLVDPTCRRKGVGTALMQAALKELEKRGAERVVLSTMVGNHPAQHLFASLGFRKTMLEMTWNAPARRAGTRRRHS
jgi:ribosomal protein S18 acetylase RimI-like enzyme